VTAPTGTPPTYTGEKQTRVISNNVRNREQDTAIFTYYDTDGNAISNHENRRDVALIKVMLIVNIDPRRKPDNTHVRSSATLRNVNKPS